MTPRTNTAGDSTSTAHAIGGFFAYNPAGQLTQTLLANEFVAPGVYDPNSRRAVTLYDYDRAGRLTSLSNDHFLGVPDEIYSFDLDTAGRIFRQTVQTIRNTPNIQLTNYKYDQTDQLNVADHTSAADESYAYDALGNRAGVTLVSNVRNRVQQDGTFTYTYDNEGNLTTKTRVSNAPAADYQTTYTWDYRNRLISVTQDGNNGPGLASTTTYFSYDALDHRIWQRVAPAVGVHVDTHFFYQGDQLLFARSDDGGVTDRFLRGPGGQVLAQDTASSPHWLFTDHLGSVHTVMVADGGILGRINYDSFGNVAAGSLTPVAAGSLFGFAGSVYDATTGLDYMNARYYDPASGRFLSEDPIDADPNPYRYVGNNPINLVDPSGLSAQRLGVGNSYNSSSPYDYFQSYAAPHAYDYDLAPPQPAAVPSNYYEPVAVSQPSMWNSVSKSVSNNASYAGAFVSSLWDQSYSTGSDVLGGLYDLATVPAAREAFAGAWQTTRVQPLGQRYYDVTKSLGYTDSQIGNENSLVLTQAVAGDLLSTNQAVEAIYNVDLATQRQLTGVERAQRGLQVGSNVLLGVAGGLQAAGVNPRIGSPPPSSRGIWDLTPEARWTSVEQQLGKNLPSNYPVIDRFENGIATSIKSMDLGAPTYADPAAISRVGQGYIDKVAGFQGRNWAKFDIRANQITGRGMELAVPPGATPAQAQALQGLIEYGRQQGVRTYIPELH